MRNSTFLSLVTACLPTAVVCNALVPSAVLRTEHFHLSQRSNPDKKLSKALCSQVPIICPAPVDVPCLSSAPWKTTAFLCPFLLTYVTALRAERNIFFILFHFPLPPPFRSGVLLTQKKKKKEELPIFDKPELKGSPFNG